jgi:hypothetical protein
MSFDDEVDELKKELATGKLDPAQRQDVTAKLCAKLKETVSSRRLEFAVDARTTGRSSPSSTPRRRSIWLPCS